MIGVMVRMWADSSWNIYERPWQHRRWWSTKVNAQWQPDLNQIERTTRASKWRSTSQPSPKMDKGKTKMSEYEDDPSNNNESTHSLDSQLDAFYVPLMRSPRVQKALTSANENSVTPPARRIQLADSIATIIWHTIMPLWWRWQQIVNRRAWPKPQRTRDGSKQWMSRCKHLARTRHGISSLTHLTRRKSVADGYITWSINYADGSINRYKARLVAKGYMHKCTVSTMKRPLPQWRRWQLFEP